jgi:hypothetical protein
MQTTNNKVTRFLWLLANNKVLTRDNLAKRRPVDDPTCLFCSELESSCHLFFQCCVAKVLWTVISEITEVPVGADFESVAKLWIREGEGPEKATRGEVNVSQSKFLTGTWPISQN